jgi:hypothetical protein
MGRLFLSIIVILVDMPSKARVSSGNMSPMKTVRA